ncbi:MAG TPA: hypothetical protein VFP50_15360 [Anaeromyxobacteraceae bacterium]|nr:hypothetical protein [Anaeromyxobacteraceae bacterium]
MSLGPDAAVTPGWTQLAGGGVALEREKTRAPADAAARERVEASQKVEEFVAGVRSGLSLALFVATKCGRRLSLDEALAIVSEWKIGC